MGSAADPSSTSSSCNHHSPELPADGGVDGSPLRRGNLSSLWAHVVRGGELESISAVHQSPPSSSSSLSSLAPSVSEQIPFSDCSPSKAAPAPAPSSPPPPPMMNNSSAAEDSNGNSSGIAVKPKKPAWNKPSNGVVEVGSVMGAVSWPALSESARASPKQSADSSSKPLTDGSISTSQGLVKTYSPKKQVNSNANSNSNHNHPLQTRQRSMKRGGGGGAGGGPAHSNFTHPPPPPPPPPPPFPIYPLPANTYGSLMPAIPEPSPRDPLFCRPVPGPGFMSQPQLPVNDHRNSSRRGNFAHHPPGDGPYHNNYGGRRDQDRGNFGNGRDAPMPPLRGPPPPPRGFLRPGLPPNAAAFIAPPHARPFPNHMVYPDIVYFPFPFDPTRGGTFIGPSVSSMFGPPAELSLSTLLVNQIDYYFSDANLVRDEFLRSNMDDQGWVPISLIASFPRVKGLTPNVQLILSSLRASSLVEVQDDKVRRRTDWKKWVPTSARLSTEQGSLSRGNSSQNLLAASLQKITLEEAAPSQNSISGKADHNSEDHPDQHSTESTAQSQLANGEVTQNTH